MSRKNVQTIECLESVEGHATLAGVGVVPIVSEAFGNYSVFQSFEHG
jgi:hypothetical protein